MAQLGAYLRPKTALTQRTTRRWFALVSAIAIVTKTAKAVKIETTTQMDMLFDVLSSGLPDDRRVQKGSRFGEFRDAA